MSSLKSHRRGFLTTAAAAMTGASVSSQISEPYRIDCQSHLYVPELLALMEKRQISPRVYRRGPERYVQVNQWVRKVLPKHTDVAAKIADMDGAQIRTTMLSINDPGPELFGVDGPKVARLVHDYLADVMRAHPSRFIGLATLPLQDMDVSLQELDRCVNKLGFRGVLLYSNLDGSWPDEPPVPAAVPARRGDRRADSASSGLSYHVRANRRATKWRRRSA